MTETYAPHPAEVEAAARALWEGHARHLRVPWSTLPLAVAGHWRQLACAALVAARFEEARRRRLTHPA